MPEKNKERMQQLAEKWLKGTITSSERRSVQYLFNQTSDEPLSIDQNREEYRNYLFSRIQTETGILQPTRIRLWPKVAVSAAAVAVIAFGLYSLPYPAPKPLSLLLRMPTISPPAKSVQPLP